MHPLSRLRPLSGLHVDATGQLVTEWALLTITIIIPLIALVPMTLEMIRLYSYRITEVICLPFP